MSDPALIELIPIYGVIQRTGKRREYKLSTIENWIQFEHELLVNNSVKVLTWIDQNTTDEFFLDPSTIAFRDEKDAIMFKLGFKNGN